MKLCPYCEGECSEWEPRTDGQQSHYLAGEVWMCDDCGETLSDEEVEEQ